MELIEERGVDPNREGNNPHNGNTSNNSITIAKLLNGVKKTKFIIRLTVKYYLLCLIIILQCAHTKTSFFVLYIRAITCLLYADESVSIDGNIFLSELNSIQSKFFI